MSSVYTSSDVGTWSRSDRYSRPIGPDARRDSVYGSEGFDEVNQAKQAGNDAFTKGYQKIAGQSLQTVTKMSPYSMNFTSEGLTVTTSGHSVASPQPAETNTAAAGPGGSAIEVVQVARAYEVNEVDANGRFDLETAIAYAKMLRDYPLFWYEEAGDPLDYHLQATLADFYPGPMATGENLFSHQDARNLIRFGGMRPDRDWLQFDCALSYGLCEYLRTLEVLKTYGWSPSRCIPHGGHQMSLNIAAGLGLGGNESYPDLFQPYGGFPDGVRVEDGHITMPDLPGIGFEGKSDLYKEMRALSS